MNSYLYLEIEYVMQWLKSLFNKHSRASHSVHVQNCIYGIHCPHVLQTKLNLSDFRFIRAIGHGYASTVFEANHIPSGFRCVIKIVIKSRLNANEHKRMRREINIHSSISHRHILTFYASFEDENAFYLVLEYAQNGDLLTYLKHQNNECVTLQRFLSFVLQPLLHALVYLHKGGILHRDIKPENILIDKTGHIRLCDFGLSIKSFTERPRSVLGTLEYMAPEMFVDDNMEENNRNFTDRLDVWAIGVLTYECLTGGTPFHGRNDNEIIKNIKHADIDTSKIKNKTACEFIALCLQKDPNNRPPVSELLQHSLLHPSIPSQESQRRSFSFSS